MRSDGATGDVVVNLLAVPCLVASRIQLRSMRQHGFREKSQALSERLTLWRGNRYFQSWRTVFDSEICLL